MIHFLYLIAFALFISTVFAVFTDGTDKEKIKNGLKYFAEFVGVSLLMAWVFYFIPW